jgi:type IV secretion system protein VirB9
MRALIVAAFLVVAVPAGVLAAENPHPGVLDPRIQTIDYDPDQVVLLHGTLGYQFMLEFAPGERIETVSIGDAMGWQVTPNRKADVLFIKPIDKSSITNLTVLTDARRYAFELRVSSPDSAGPAMYIARMVYPQPALAVVDEAPPAPEAPPVVANAAYAVTGAQDIKPARIFDDGHMTYFEWRPEVSTPAIFAVSADGSESLVNYVVRGPYVVVDQVSARFDLRDGKQVATVVNQALPQLARGKAKR